MKEEYRKVPSVALRGMAILPGMVAHFDVSRNRSVRALEAAMMDDQMVFLVTQKNVEKEDPELEDLYTVGIIAVIKQVIKMQNNVVRVLVEGETRARLLSMEQEECLLAEVEPLQRDEELMAVEIQEAMLRGIRETFTRYCMLNPKPGKELARQMIEITDLDKLLDHMLHVFA